MNYYVYILASRPGGSLYIGITNNVIKRVLEHKSDIVEGFTEKYHIHTLVYYEMFSKPIEAITREKQLKKWNRSWKSNLIQRNNPKSRDLYSELI